jgi:IclR family transcriptional regulator, pca regulon regulatory protein
VLEEVRRSGHALVKEELEAGLASIAVPIRDGSGTVVAAMNVSVNALRVDPASLVPDVLPLLLEAAAQIEEGILAARRPAQAYPQTVT